MKQTEFLKDEVLASISNVADSLIKFHREQGDEDLTIIDISSWDRKFIESLHTPLMMRAFARVLNEKGYLFALDPENINVIVIMEQELSNEVKSDTLDINFETFGAIWENTPQKERATVLQQLANSKMN